MNCFSSNVAVLLALYIYKDIYVYIKDIFIHGALKLQWFEVMVVEVVV